MSIDPLIAAREALVQRQGSGARYDAPNAPADQLLLARRGYAYFARKLNELTDDELFLPSLRSGWMRSHVVADVSYFARAQAIALKGLREGLSDEERAWSGDVELASTLPPRALRSLFQHTKVHLDVEWRDLSDEQWNKPLTVHGQKSLPASGLPMLCARKVWHAVVDLGNGARIAEVPEELR